MKLIIFFLVQKLIMSKGKIFFKNFCEKFGLYGLDIELEREPYR
jgi:hypothetical protein